MGDEPINVHLNKNVAHTEGGMPAKPGPVAPPESASVEEPVAPPTAISVEEPTMPHEPVLVEKPVTPPPEPDSVEEPESATVEVTVSPPPQPALVWVPVAPPPKPSSVEEPASYKGEAEGVASNHIGALGGDISRRGKSDSIPKFDGESCAKESAVHAFGKGSEHEDLRMLLNRKRAFHTADPHSELVDIFENATVPNLDQNSCATTMSSAVDFSVNESESHEKDLRKIINHKRMMKKNSAYRDAIAIFSNVRRDAEMNSDADSQSSLGEEILDEGISPDGLVPTPIPSYKNLSCELRAELGLSTVPKLERDFCAKESSDEASAEQFEPREDLREILLRKRAMKNIIEQSQIVDAQHVAPHAQITPLIMPISSPEDLPGTHPEVYSDNEEVEDYYLGNDAHEVCSSEVPDNEEVEEYYSGNDAHEVCSSEVPAHDGVSNACETPKPSYKNLSRELRDELGLATVPKLVLESQAPCEHNAINLSSYQKDCDTYKTVSSIETIAKDHDQQEDVRELLDRERSGESSPDAIQEPHVGEQYQRGPSIICEDALATSRPICTETAKHSDRIQAKKGVPLWLKVLAKMILCIDLDHPPRQAVAALQPDTARKMFGGPPSGMRS